MVEIRKEANPGQSGWLSEALDKHIDSRIKASNNYKRKHRIRPSELGECTRKIVYDILNFPGRQTVDPKAQRNFDNGNKTHERYLKSYLPKLGVMCKIWIKERGRWKNVDFSEVMVEDRKLWVRGAPDAVIFNPKTGQRYIFELKTIKQELFWKLHKPYQSHIYQAHMYMYMVGVTKAIIYYENKNTQDIKEFEITFDSSIMEYLIAKIMKIQHYVTNYEMTSQLPEREYDSSICQNCKFAFKPTGCISGWNRKPVRREF